MSPTTQVQPTSTAAYKSLHNLSHRQMEVHKTIKRMGFACNQKIADHLKLPVNQVTGRVFELRKMGLVGEAHKAIWRPTGKTVVWWRVI